ncbi:MAG: hypothetical protein ACOXZR_02835 [Bacilli bacterium]|jgi:surface polysaccharide O-acyltransferase-like enzyme
MKKINKKYNIQLGLAIFLIVAQIISILGCIESGNNSFYFFDNIFEFIGYYIVGIVGIVTLIIELKKRKNKKGPGN